MKQLEHPVITALEHTGYPSWKEPEYPHCPVCGAECGTVYMNNIGEIFGCDECVRTDDAWETPECFPERE